MTKWYEILTGPLDQKKQYRAYKARLKALPAAYRDTGAALERYLLHLGPTSDAPQMLTMLDDLTEMLEQAAAAGTPIRDLVGDDPTDFAETFMDNYGGGSWIRTERRRLGDAVARAAGEPGPGEGHVTEDGTR